MAAPLDKSVNAVLEKLRALKPDQWPRKRQSLCTWFQRLGCCRVVSELPGGASVLAKAMLALLGDAPQLKDAIAPLAGCVTEVVLTENEPATKRIRGCVRQNEFQAIFAAQVALKRLRHCKMELWKQPLSARLMWLQAQAHTRNYVTADAIISDLMKRQLIVISTDTSIAYDALAIKNFLTQKNPQGHDMKALVEKLCPFHTISVCLGDGEDQAWRKKSLLKQGLRKVVMGWCKAALAGSAIKTLNLSQQCFDVKSASIAPLDIEEAPCGEAKPKHAKTKKRDSNVKLQLKMQLQIAASMTTASMFCSELKRHAELSIGDAHSPPKTGSPPPNEGPVKVELMQLQDATRQVVPRKYEAHEDTTGQRFLNREEMRSIEKDSIGVETQLASKTPSAAEAEANTCKNNHEDEKSKRRKCDEGANDKSVKGEHIGLETKGIDAIKPAGIELTREYDAHENPSCQQNIKREEQRDGVGAETPMRASASLPSEAEAHVCEKEQESRADKRRKLD